MFWSICVSNVYSCPSSNLSGKYINTYMAGHCDSQTGWPEEIHEIQEVFVDVLTGVITLIVYSVYRMLTRWFSILWDSSCFSLFKRISNYQLNFIIMMCSYHNIFIDGKINYCKYRYCNTWLFWDTGENISSMIWTCIS